MTDITALDALIHELVRNKSFDLLANKNWDAISNLFPGTTPYQCQKRYKELKQELNAKPLSLSKTAGSTKTRSSEKSGQPKEQPIKDPEDIESAPDSANSNSSEQDSGPIMVIHVCDEAKNLKQDFSCPRNLLVKEMKYFAEYLSADSQRWEDVDISVHCDVQIFDWLMKFVKRGTKDVPLEPELETINVISILISSDFLKMDNLVDRCIVFCHRHMNAILSTPCNMNCINDKLVTRIAALFNHNEIEELKDRKDKFRSKLFAKKVEKMFDIDSPNNQQDSPENATTLYKCKACEKILTKNLEKKLRCISSRMLVNKHGKLVYIHERDPTWDASDYLVYLKSELKTWRDVYWHLWGTVNYLSCTRCMEFFACKELGGCLYHKDRAIYQSDVSLGRLSGAVGTYLCCGERVLRFDPTEENRGCQAQDHLIQIEDGHLESKKLLKVYEDLLAYRHMVTVPVTPKKPHPMLEINVFANEEFASGLRDNGLGMCKQSNILKQPPKSTEFQAPKLEALTQEVYEEEEDISDKSDDELGDDETKVKMPLHLRRKRIQVMVKSNAILVDGPEFAGHYRNKWDGSRSVRFNQDAQRQEDVVRLRDMVNYLTRLRIGKEKLDKNKQKDYVGGIYAKLEGQWRASLLQSKAINASIPRSSRGKLGNMKP